MDLSAIDALRDRWQAGLAAVQSLTDLKTLGDEFLGRKSGSITALMKTLGSLPAEHKREFGALVNALKQEIETSLTARREALEATQLPAGSVDVTLPGRPLPLGRVHPLQPVRPVQELLELQRGRHAQFPASERS
jgi:phenylalanyl-tRNA synthetase alpha chain